MEFNRTELMPGVFLSHLRSDKFKTACMSVTLLTQLRRETAAMNAVIPFVLRRGTTRYSDMEQLSRRMDELYGAAVEPVVRRIGEIQCIGFYGSSAIELMPIVLRNTSVVRNTAGRPGTSSLPHSSISPRS